MLRRTFNKIIALLPLVGLSSIKAEEYDNEGCEPCDLKRMLENGDIQLSPNNTRKILETAPISFAKPDKYGWGQPLIYYQNKWLRLCSVDLCEDVWCCAGKYKDIEGTRKLYLDALWLGAKVRDNRFGVVDNITDG